MTPPARPRRSLSHPAHRIAAGTLCVLAMVASASTAWSESHRYVIQPEASEVAFRATSRFMNADGRFHRLGGEVTADPADLATARILLSIETNSIDTGIGLRDRHLRSADFFDVERFPTIAFESVRVEGSGQHVTVAGRLTMRGVTHEIAVPVDVTMTAVALVATGEPVLNPIGNEVRVTFTFRARAS